MRCFRIVLLAVGVAGMALIGRAASGLFPGVDDKWRHYASPKFELFSRVGDSESRELLENLELLHATFFEKAGLRERAPLPVTVYFFRDEDNFLAYVPVAMRSEERTAGFYLRRPDRAVIVVSPTWDSEWARRLIFHEYVHHMTSIAGENPPLWYTEGIAELFSTITEYSKGLKFGLAIPQHVQVLRQEKLMPLDVLFAVDHSSGIYNESQRSGLFYAESWALLHYWYCGDLKLTPEQKQRRQHFFRYISNEGEHGNPEVRHREFVQAMGLDYPATVRELWSYARDGRYRWFKLDRPQIAPPDSYAVRAVSREEITEQLASLDLRVNRSPAAKLALLDRLGDKPNDPVVNEVLGMDAEIAGDDDQARERWNAAIAGGTTNPAIFQELAAVEDRAWFSRFDFSFRMPGATAQRLRELLHRSIAAAPNQARAYEILAWVEATAEKPSPAEINLVQLHLHDVTDRARTLLALAAIRVRVDDFATARAILDLIDKDGRQDMRRPSEFLRDYMAQHEPAAEPPAESGKGN